MNLILKVVPVVISYTFYIIQYKVFHFPVNV